MNDLDYNRLKVLLSQAGKEPDEFHEWEELKSLIISEIPRVPRVVVKNIDELVVLGLIIVGCGVIERILDRKLSGG